MNPKGNRACGKCNDVIDEDEPYLACTDCSICYHLGGACSGVSENTFKSKRDDYKKSWRCPSCRKSKASASAPKENNETIASMLIEINRKLDELLPLKQTVNDIEVSVQLLSSKYDSILEAVARHDTDIKALGGRVTKLEKLDTNKELLAVSAAVNDLEYHSRKLNLEIHGIKQEKNENLRDKINTLASKLELAPLTENTVTSVHRLLSKNDRTPGVIIRFSSQETRDCWLAKRKYLSIAHPGLFITENLTAQNRMLLKAAKEWARANKFSFAWHRNGKVFVRKKEGDNACLIRCTADLAKLVA